MQAPEFDESIAIIGWSCRVPGANSIAALWNLLRDGRCAVTQIPPDRFALRHFGHLRKGERGRSYTWAAGVLDDVWGFDPGVFGISPREAQQMDPQQRILLQLAWEALEDAGIRPSTLAGTEVGVFVGGAVSENAHAMYGDPSIADSHFATGHALAVLANRISYVFDLRGPSITIDTACSSSLVAIHQAIEAIRSGRIDTAIVGGINVLAAPTSYVTFSQASMLSPTGRCRAFSADADGYVRAEGGGVLVLRKVTHAHADLNKVHGVILASDVNSDGRTNGISLPSREAQESLLRRVYEEARVSPERLSFVEAHGTGTPAGDPIEANSIGTVLGCNRSNPLPIGSIKTNIGHLEPASGMAGVIKSILALNHGVLPPSLNFTSANPKIDLEALNLRVCQKPMTLGNSRQHVAGVNSFGFGGTNAHVIVGPGVKSATAQKPSNTTDRFLYFSAECKPALIELAQRYRERVATLSDDATAAIASATAHQRDLLTNRLVVTTTRKNDVTAALDAFLAGSGHKLLSTGEAAGKQLPVAFIYSGNGSQWKGMGRAAYRNCAAFRAQIDEIDHEFTRLAGWSLREAMFDEKLEERLVYTNVAQPLIFAIQLATTYALRMRGLLPVAVLGHSVGEVAAAEAAGTLDLEQSVQLIYFRSKHQEHVRKTGRMVAVLAEPGIVRSLAAPIKGIEIAAINSPRAVTVVGPNVAIAKFVELAKQRAIVSLDLNLDYPFHSQLMAPIESALVRDLRDLDPKSGRIPFISTVTGAVISGERLGASYWWSNVRKPVQFVSAVQASAKLGAGVFLEIGPRGVLTKHISDILSGELAHYVALSAFDQEEADDSNPVDKVVAKALIAGAKFDVATISGPNPGTSVSLPSYPWQQKSFKHQPTSEAIGWFQGECHPLSGARYDEDALEWHAFVDTLVVPELADHKLAEQTILPGTGFIEIAFSTASQWLPGKAITLTEFETLTSLDLSDGETREVLTRISSGSRSFEILSRPRLSSTGWVLHARGKIVSSDRAQNTNDRPKLAAIRRTISADDLYKMADGGGLHYGPAFRQIEKVSLHEQDLISVELSSQTPKTPFVLDPVRLDCCCQGLISLFPGLRAEERGVSYIPVRVDSVSLHAPGSIAKRSVIEVLAQNERSIRANITIFDSDHKIIAELRGVRCQAVPIRRSNPLDNVAFVECSEPADGSVFGQTGLALTLKEISGQFDALGLGSVDTGLRSDSARLLDGWALTAAYEIASALSDRNIVNPDLLIQTNRISPQLRSWLMMLLSKLTAAKLAQKQNGSWALIQNPMLPPSSSIIKQLPAAHPDRAGEMFMAAEITGLANRLLADRTLKLDPDTGLSKIGIDFYDVTARSAVNAGEVLMQLLKRTADQLPQDRNIRVLQIGFGQLTHELLRQNIANITLTVFEPDKRRFERAKASLTNVGTAKVVDKLGSNSYDLILAVEALHLLPLANTLPELRKALAPDGVLLGIEPQPSFFNELLCGLRVHAQLAHFDHLHTYPPSAKTWTMLLHSAGFEEIKTQDVKYSENNGVAVIAKVRGQNSLHQQEAAHKRSMRIVRGAGPACVKIADALLQNLVFKNPKADVQISDVFDSRPWDTVPNVLIQIISPDNDGDHVESLSQVCLEIKDCGERLGSAPVKVWHIFHNAKASAHESLNPIQSGAWAFSRTFANEFQHLDVRRIDVAGDLSKSEIVRQLMTILHSESAETELQIDGRAMRVFRAERFAHAHASHAHTAPAATLERGTNSKQRLIWQPAARKRPNANEVEIEVAATGLNFRDVMCMLRLLPDDILEDGLIGPALGLECAGTIVAVGESVDKFKIGDRVATMAPVAFATHVIASLDLVAAIPNDVSFEAASTIPSAFATATYSLIELARLQRDEWVLIHAGSGAVGMAAIQIAQGVGAKIIATAGSEAKRDLLRAFGVRHVFDSRSTRFVEEIQKITGSGVHVVLNSLAGDAMERSVACLAPFGRFIELGKRDFVANTNIGLRPFRKNLSYFGVDLDHVLASRPQVGRKMFGKIMRNLASGKISPLPYCVFDSAAVTDAFQLMQKAGHVGKIVVRPPKAKSIRVASKTFAVDPQATHLITGGLGGLGLAAAKWLADRGARHLVLIGRRGIATDEARNLVDDLMGRGVNVLAKACDVADPKQVEALFAQMRETMPRLGGVIHSAMVLDDTIIANLSAARFKPVLEPKLRGADNLDRMTRELSLDYFVLFSSVVTLIGNRGQGSYVAANAYLEGLARCRRNDGLPGLAIGWGPITDVGVVARTERMRTDLRKIGGVRGMQAQEALDLMGLALTEAANDRNLAAITIAPHEAAFSADLLPVLRSPTYKNLIRSEDKLADGPEGRVDLHALLSSQDQDAVRETVIQVIVNQLARVLCLNKDDVSRVRPLSEMGLDSLMALELIVSLEEIFAIQMAPARAAGNLPNKPVTNFADEIIASVGTKRMEAGDSNAVRIMEQHVVKVDPGQIAIVSKILQNANKKDEILQQ